VSSVVIARDEATAASELYDQGLTDGLPIVVPTVERVERMVLASGLDPDMSLGKVGPSGGEATIQVIATNAVMAGCIPDYFPVVVATIEAVCDSTFDSTEIQVTTHSLAPLIIVNGPIRSQVGIVSEHGALGPGHRANATIGRALRLVLMNVGGGYPGLGDMALLGHPGKFTFCLGENEEESPFEPYHHSLGYDRSDSTVTVVAVEGPHSVVARLESDDPKTAEELLNLLGRVCANPGSNSTYFDTGSIIVLLNPAHARVLSKAGYTRQSIQRELALRARNTKRSLREVNSFLVPNGGDDDALMPKRDPGQFIIIVTGGAGMYSAVCLPWSAGPNGNVTVTKLIVTDQACSIGGGPG
jgi:hypothetical protein